jgi:hypothetical protein
MKNFAVIYRVDIVQACALHCYVSSVVLTLLSMP